MRGEKGRHAEVNQSGMHGRWGERGRHADCLLHFIFNGGRNITIKTKQCTSPIFASPELPDLELRTLGSTLVSIFEILGILAPKMCLRVKLKNVDCAESPCTTCNNCKLY